MFSREDSPYDTWDVDGDVFDYKPRKERRRVSLDLDAEDEDVRFVVSDGDRRAGGPAKGPLGDEAGKADASAGGRPATGEAASAGVAAAAASVAAGSGTAGSETAEARQVPDGSGGAGQTGRIALGGIAPDAGRHMAGTARMAAGRGKPGTSGKRLLLALLVLGALAAALVGVNVFLAASAPKVRSVAGDVAQAAQQAMADALRKGEDTCSLVRERSSWVVCIDAGHGAYADLSLTPVGPGSYDMQYVEPGGTSGIYTGIEEYRVNLAVALMLQQKLEAQGVTVAMVRTTDEVVLSSEQRAYVANSCGADIFIRLHCDGADDPYAYGFSTLVPGYNEWTWPIADASVLAAQIMHPVIIAETGANDRGITQRTDLAGFNFCAVPSILFEMGFLSNPDEDYLLSSTFYQEILAQAICDATIVYLETVLG